MRHFASVLCFMLVIWTFFSTPAAAATTTVTSVADDGSVGTLRYAIANAVSGDTIDFSVTGTITLTSGELLIQKSLTITGPGAHSLTISGNNSSRVFDIGSGTNVTISGLTIQNGISGSGGGGIYNGGTLTLTNSTLSGNSASGGGAIYNLSATLIVTNSTLSGNSATAGGGGAIENYLGTLTLTKSTLSGNSATGSNGGGIYNLAATLTVTDSTLSGNSTVRAMAGGNVDGGYGGGIFNGGTLTVTNSTLSGNSATNVGGAIWDGSTLTVTNSTLSGNSASIYAGGIFIHGDATLKNSIVANNPSGGNCYLDTPITSQGHNLSDDATCSTFFNQPSDLNNTPAGLDLSGLQSNGGPTQTIALLATSPAVDAIPLSPTNYCTDVGGNPVTTDQRGIARPQGLACDIGAFEYSSDNDSSFAVLTGANTFTGNQTVNGLVTATSFVGDGSGLTGVIAASANIANLANFATSAGDAETLGGNPASAFAPATGSPNYVAKAGDTLTGALNLPANGLTAGGNQLVLSSGNVGVGTTTPENLPGYRSLHIDSSVTGFGGAFVELTHSTTGQKGRVVMDDNGFLLNSINSAPVKIKSSNFNGGSDPGHIYVSTSGNVGIGTGTPAAKLDVNGAANFSGLVTFAAGQTFPGTGGGTITGVTAGTGLSGGGTGGNVTLTNTGLLSLTGGNGVTTSGGQNPALSLNTNFTDSRYLQLSGGSLSGNLSAPGFNGNGTGLTNLNPANLSSGTANINIAGLAASATNALNLGGNPPSLFATTGANRFTGAQSVSGDVNATGTISASTVNINGPYINGLQGGLFTTGINVGTTGRATSSQGFPSYPLQFWSSSFNGSFGQPWLQSFQWVSEPTGNNTPNPSATLNLQALNGPIIPPPPTGYTMQETGFSIGSSGQITIAGGTAIRYHASVVFQNVTFNTKMSPATCTVWSGPMSSLFDGDTVVVTMGSSLMTANIVYSAWATNGGVNVRICNPTGAPTTVGAGNIRVDVWKH